jgi:hypothetical protein
MGWFSCSGDRKQVIAELTKPDIKTWPGLQVEYRVVTLKHCYRGNAFSGILWSVRERRGFKKEQQIDHGDRWIHCDLMQYRDGQWWYKPMIEASHPYYYSCPKKYLQLVPDAAPETCAEWREKVRQYHETAAQRRLEKTQLAAKY